SSPVLVSGDRVGQAVVRFTNSGLDRKSTRLNSSHVKISYAVFCLKKKGTTRCTNSADLSNSSMFRETMDPDTLTPPLQMLRAALYWKSPTIPAALFVFF